MFVKITNGKVTQYPYTAGDLRRDNPNVSFPKNIPNGVFARYGVYPVGYQAAPEYDPMTHLLSHSYLPEREITGYYTEDDAPMPEMVNEPIYSGRWILTKTVVALTEEQIAERDARAAKAVRKKRGELITETDWMALTDSTMPAEVAAYRQALRDITGHVAFPHLSKDDWPTKP